MIEDKLLIVPECSDGDIKHWIQFFSKIENVEKAPHQALQNDIFFYLNALKYFKDKSEEMKKTLISIREQIQTMQDDSESPNLRHNTGVMILFQIEQALKGVETK